MAERGWSVAGWTVPAAPGPMVLEGRYARLEPLAVGQAAALHSAFAADDATWDFLPYGPFAGIGEYARWIEKMAASRDPLFFALVDRESGVPRGVMSFLRITPEAGAIEVGHISLTPPARRTRMATEAIYLLAAWAFGAGYRRFEWKCDALNLPSRRAAIRFGFSYEGIFRQAAVVKGRNRDTAWFAMVDGDWRCLASAYETWLDPGNFSEGRQVAPLDTKACRVAEDPAVSA